MTRRLKNRILTFERLDAKATPSSLLLALAPLDEPFHQAVERERENAAGDLAELAVATTGSWHFAVSTSDLLRFVENNSSRRVADTRQVVLPTPDECRRADEMMKLGDHDTRAVIIADSLTGDAAARDEP
jgi:hypothetical protein